MATSTQKNPVPEQKDMRLCYVFSSSETKNSPEVTERAEQFLASHKASAFHNRYLACGTLERLAPPEKATEPAVVVADEAALEEGQTEATNAAPSPEPGLEDPEGYPGYLFFMKFRYEALDEVAMHVLEGRQHFKDYLSRTLTLLEYPRFADDEKARGLTPSEEHQMLERVGILLVQSRAGALGIDSKKTLESCCSAQGRTCVEVLGPYDYVIEFPAETHDELRAMYLVVGTQMKGRYLRLVPMLCTIFHPRPAAKP